MSSWITTFGLALDILGSILLLFFGIPPKIDPEGHVHLITEEIDQEEVKKGKKFKVISSFAISLLILGFIGQLIGVWVD